MKSFIKSLFCLLLLTSNSNFAQEFDGYKYFIVHELDYGANGKDIYGLQKDVVNYLLSRGYTVISGGNGWSESMYPNDLKLNPCLGLFINISHNPTPPAVISLNFQNCQNKIIKTLSGKSIWGFPTVLNQIFGELNKIKFYSFDESLTPTPNFPIVENIKKDENEIKGYLDSKTPDPIEGIYKSYKSDTNYKIGIIKVGEAYKAIIIESELPHWKKGDVKAIFESTSIDGVFSTKYYLGNKNSYETFANLEGGLITIEFKNGKGEKVDSYFLKLYPKN